MEFIKAKAEVIMFKNEDIVMSGEKKCTNKGNMKKDAGTAASDANA